MVWLWKLHWSGKSSRTIEARREETDAAIVAWEPTEKNEKERMNNYHADKNTSTQKFVLFCFWPFPKPLKKLFFYAGSISLSSDFKESFFFAHPIYKPLWYRILGSNVCVCRDIHFCVRMPAMYERCICTYMCIHMYVSMKTYLCLLGSCSLEIKENFWWKLESKGFGEVLE